MNEELQSTNEELETINTELRTRSEELNQANAFYTSVLSGLDVGVAVVDPSVGVLTWNDQAEELWGLRAEEVRGRHLMNLDIGLPVERLLAPIRSVLAGEPAQDLSVACVNRRGRQISCQLHLSPLKGALGDIEGVIILMREKKESAG
jgi:two-component system CheB/CheR fusion protein